MLHGCAPQKFHPRLTQRFPQANIHGGVEQFGTWLADDPAEKIFIQSGVSRIRFNEAELRAALDFDAALLLADEIRAAMGKVKDLAERKEGLGLK